MHGKSLRSIEVEISLPIMAEMVVLGAKLQTSVKLGKNRKPRRGREYRKNPLWPKRRPPNFYLVPLSFI